MKRKTIIILSLIFSLCILFKFLKQDNKSSGVMSKEVIVPTQAYDDTSITLAWLKMNNYKEISGYNIYMNGKLIANTDNNSSSHSEAKSLINRFYKENRDDKTVKIATHTCTVAGLKPNTMYKFYISAVNSYGKELTKSNTLIQHTSKAPKIFNIVSYGAVGDGKTLDTKAIQAAVNACTSGGEVLIPQGKVFKSGSLFLKSNMIFKVDGKLLGSESTEDYANVSHNALINAAGNKKAENLKIIGTGVIDGNGWKQSTADAETGFPDSLKSSIKTVSKEGILAASQYNLGKNKGFSDIKAYSHRSNLIDISHIDDVYFGDGLSFENPAQHTIVINHCNDVVLNNALIKTFDCNNGDGIDFDSEGLTVLNSVFDTGDDDINFTAGRGEEAEKKRSPVRNVWIFNNYFGRGHGAVTAGSNTAAWIENVLAEDNVLDGTGAGLRCKTAEGTGGGARNITFRDSALKDITDGEGEPFIFTSAYSNSNTDVKYKPAHDLPQFKDIYVSNCSVDGSKGSAVFVLGLKGACHENIHFQDVFFRGTKPAEIRYMKNSTFKNVTFDSSIKDPWNISDSMDVTINKK